MSENAEFPASELKLLRLRREGIIPFSGHVLTFGCLLALFILIKTSCFGMVSGFFNEVSGWQLGLLSGSAEVNLESVSLMSLKMALVSLLFIFFVVVLCGLLQTRFLFSFKAISPSLANIFQGFSGGMFGRFLVSFETLLSALGWMFIAVLSCIYLLADADVFVKSEKVESLLRNEYQYIQQYSRAGPSIRISRGRGLEVVQELQRVKGKIERVVAGATIYSLFLGVMSYFVEYLRFHKRHRMSRSEVEQEISEEELSPEIRREMWEKISQS